MFYSLTASLSHNFVDLSHYWNFDPQLVSHRTACRSLDRLSQALANIPCGIAETLYQPSFMTTPPSHNAEESDRGLGKP